MIKAVIWDVGGVLVRTEDRAPRQALEARLGLQPGEAEHLVYNSEMGQKAQRGEITAAELWRWIQAHFRFDDGEVERFRRQFWGGDRLNAPLLSLVRTLRPRYQTAIISNAMDDLLDTLTVEVYDGSAWVSISGAGDFSAHTGTAWAAAGRGDLHRRLCAQCRRRPRGRHGGHPLHARSRRRRRAG